MQTLPPPKHLKPAGYALPLTLMFLAIALMVFGSIMYWMTSNAIVTERNNLYGQAQAAAESATENVLTTMMRDFTYGALNPADDYRALLPATDEWPVRFSFADTNGAPNQTTVGIGDVTWTELPSQFRGLYGLGQNCVVASTATTVGRRYDVSSTVSQSLWFGSIPLFQYAIFYNMDMEINPGAAMVVNGRVHSNGNIWATGSSSSSPLTFSTNVDASGTVSNVPSSLDPQNYGKRAGNVVYRDPNSPVQYYDSLTLPIGTATNNNPTNVTAILNLPPASMAAPLPTAYSTNGQIYLYNACDLIVSNSALGFDGISTSSNALTVYYQNPNRAFPLTVVTPDATVVSSVASNSVAITTGYVTNITSSGSGRHKSYTTNVTTVTITNVTTTYFPTTNYFYSFVTNVTFYDYRESKTVQAVQIDIGRLDVWLTNNSATGGYQYEQFNSAGSSSKGHGIWSIYVYSAVPMNASTLPAVRVSNGQQLPPDGLTVATCLPIYVKGDYNVTTDGVKYSRALGDTTNTVPASLLADAITILSANWKDSWGAGTGLSSRTPGPTDTYVNAAALEGIVPSNGAHYSGGVENFLRLLENWSGHTVGYNGSIAVMFPSRLATNFWQTTGVYYNAPTRQWGFDPNYAHQNGLPPLTPQMKATIRGDYVAQ